MMVWASVYCADISLTFCCSLLLLPASGTLSNKAWNMLSNVKLVMRIAGMSKICASRHGRDSASEIIAWTLCRLRKSSSFACGTDVSKASSACNDSFASSC